MSYSDKFFPRPVEFRVNDIEEFLFLIIEIASCHIRHRIRHLDHACELAVNKKGRLNNMVDFKYIPCLACGICA